MSNASKKVARASMVIAPRALWPALLLAAGCRPSAIGANASATVGVRERDECVERLQSRLCENEGSCCLTRVIDAGASTQGHELAVAVAARGPCTAPELTPAIDEGTCEDYWLVERRNVADVPPRWIGNACDGTRTEILTSIDRRMRTFTFGTQGGFSNDVTHDAVTIGLDPVRLVATDAWTQNSSHGDHESWSWDTFSGALELGVDYCPGKEPAGVDVGMDRDAPSIEVRAVAIPRVTLPVAFVDGGWRTIALGHCAARIDTAGRGFALGTSTKTADDAAFGLILSPENDLFVEVQDDHWVTADELEIWVATSTDCVDPTAPARASEWHVRMVDGHVSAGRGHPVQLPFVESQRDGNRVRLRVGLEKVIGRSDRLTVVYSDSDDGIHAKSRIATSELQDDKWWTLGAPHSPGAELATADTVCEIESGTLSPRTPAIGLAARQSGTTFLLTPEITPSAAIPEADGFGLVGSKDGPVLVQKLNCVH